MIAQIVTLRYQKKMTIISQSNTSGVSVASRAALLASWLEEHKGRDIMEISMTEKGHYCDCMVLVTANSMRHAQGLADGLVSFCHENGQEFLHIEGYTCAQWILLDLNDILVHIFQEDSRRIYGLETLWGCPDAHNIRPLFQEALDQ